MTRTRWNSERVIAAIRQRQQQGLSINLVYREDRSLQNAGHRCFGSWRRALLAVGIVLPERRRWTPERILEAIRQRHQQGLNMFTVGREDSGLDQAARRCFGTWGAAVRAAGLAFPQRPTWSRQCIIETLRDWYQTPSTKRPVWRENLALRSAMRYYFRNLGQALRAAGLPLHYPRKWTKQRILEELRTRCGNGASTVAFWQDRALAKAAIAYFGSCHDAFLAAGLKPIRSPRNWWTRARVVAGIRARQQQGLPLTNVIRHDARLYSAAHHLFGSWRQAMAAAGIDRPRKHK